MNHLGFSFVERIVLMLNYVIALFFIEFLNEESVYFRKKKVREQEKGLPQKMRSSRRR